MFLLFYLNICRFEQLHQGLTKDVSSVVGAPWRCGVLTTVGGVAGIGLGRLLGGEHASTPQSGVEAPSLLKRSLSRLYYCCCCCCCCCWAVGFCWVLLGFLGCCRGFCRLFVVVFFVRLFLFFLLCYLLVVLWWLWLLWLFSLSTHRQSRVY